MAEFFVGVGSIALRFRHARSLKDKRRLLEGLSQKMRNLGCSVSEYDEADNPKMGRIGFSIVNGESFIVDNVLEKVNRLLIGDYEVLGCDTKVLPMSNDSLVVQSEEEEWKYDP